MKRIMVASIVLAAGCATPDQLRQAEAQSAEQGYAVKKLRADQEGNAAQLERMRQETQQLASAVTEARALADAAKVQSENAQSVSRELLASLVAAREEQKRQLEENSAAFTELRRKNAELEAKLQRTVGPGATSLNNAIARLDALEQASRQATALEAKLLQNDTVQTQQLAALGKQQSETRALLTSSGLLELMRQVEEVRHQSASLRGSIDELQKAQADAATQIRNYYLDLDVRLRAIKQSPSASGVKQYPPAPETPPAIPLAPGPPASQ